MRRILKDDWCTLLFEEMKHLDKVAKKRLLSEAGIQMDILPEKGLAMKADLSIPWRKLRKIRRLLMVENNC